MGTDPDMKKGFLAEALDLIGSGGLLPIQAIPLRLSISSRLSIT